MPKSNQLLISGAIKILHVSLPQLMTNPPPNYISYLTIPLTLSSCAVQASWNNRAWVTVMTILYIILVISLQYLRSYTCYITKYIVINSTILNF